MDIARTTQETLGLMKQSLTKNVTLYGEFWSDYNNDLTRKTTQYSFDLAAAWLVRPNLQLDAGLDFGLNSATSKIQVFAGISQRF